MTQPEEPEPEPSLREPTRELLLAQALDACIAAERLIPGSAQEIILAQPDWARGDLQRLLALAGSLDAAATNAVMSEEFRVAARGRLMQRIGAGVQERSERRNGTVPLVLPGVRPVAMPRWTSHPPGPGGRGRWWWRASALLFAAVLGVTATVSASASALPGELLYGIKQAHEEVNIRLASDDQARALVLLRQGDARLDETARLLQQGRTDEALVTTQRFDQVVERATTTYVVTINDALPDLSLTNRMQSKLTEQQDQLQALVASAPEPVRADLREALVATERGRALVADPRPVERALGRSRGKPVVAAEAVPTVAAEEEPTPVPVPTARPATVVALSPAAPVLLAEVAQHESNEDAGVSERDSGRGNDENRPAPIVHAQVAPAGAARKSITQPARRSNAQQDEPARHDQPVDRSENESPSPAAVVAHETRPATDDADEWSPPPRVRTSPGAGTTTRAQAPAGTRGATAPTDARERDDGEVQAPPAVARQVTNSAVVQEGREGGERGTAGQPTRSTPPQTQAQVTTQREGADRRDTDPQSRVGPPGQAGKPTPTATRAQHDGDKPPASPPKGGGDRPGDDHRPDH